MINLIYDLEGKRMYRLGKRLALLLLSASLVIGLSIGGASSSLADATSTSDVATYHYVAFGDSLTAGYEPGMDETSIPYGFVDRIYEQALYQGRAKLDNYGILGLTSEGLKNYLQAVSEGKVVTAPEIQAGIPDPRIEQMLLQVEDTKKSIISANLITITIGGNDVREFPALLPGKTNAQVEELANEYLDIFTENMYASLLLINELNPKAKIIIADQYQPVPSIDRVLYEQLNLVKDMFSERVDSIATTMQVDHTLDVDVAHVSESFVGKELSHTHILKRDIHPTQLGYLAMSSRFAEVIWGEYKQPLRREPIAVLVGGKEPLTIPILLNGTTFLPMRECAELLGAEVEWDGPTKTVTVSFKGKSVQFVTDSGSPDVLLYSEPGQTTKTTYIALRSMGESLGFDVQYSVKSKTAFINE
jgi:lysophospholipase L1-like esterase